MNPNAMLVICAVVCVVVIVAYSLATLGQEQIDHVRRLAEADGDYARTMAALGVPGMLDYPEGVLTGCWGKDPNADAWWWRCSLCRELDHSLSPAAAAIEASTHECNPVALQAAKDDAKRQHPANRDLGSAS